MPEERLQKLLAHAGIASRRNAEQLIREGRVKVNGAVITELGSKADAERDHIKVDGKRVSAPEKPVYLAMIKPRCLCRWLNNDADGFVGSGIPAACLWLWPA